MTSVSPSDNILSFTALTEDGIALPDILVGHPDGDQFLSFAVLRFMQDQLMLFTLYEHTKTGTGNVPISADEYHFGALRWHPLSGNWEVDGDEIWRGDCRGDMETRFANFIPTWNVAQHIPPPAFQEAQA